MNARVLVAVVGVFVACGFNVFFLEHLVKFSPGCGDLVTFSQFFFTAAFRFVTVTKCGTVPPVVPLREYFFAVLLYFASSLTGNLAFLFNISMPIQMIFKSGSVMASMLLGILILKKQYSTSKYVSVAMITIGIAMCLLLSSNDKPKKAEEQGDMFSFICGISLLLVSLFTGARLGITQQEMVSKFGKHPKEMTCYIHLLSLPFFVFFAKNIMNQLYIFSQAELEAVDWFPVKVPLVWIYFALNIFTQFLCVTSVTTLTSELSALAITVILTLRKFMSLIVSIVYFRNPFTFYHWMGTVLVFTGTLIFSEVPQRMLASKEKPDQGKKDD